MLRYSCSCVAFAICAFWFSADALAIGLDQKIYSDRINESLGTQKIFILFAGALRSNTSIPFEAIGSDDYRQIISRLRQMGQELEQTDMRLLSDEKREELTSRINLLIARVNLLKNPLIAKTCTTLPLDLDSAAYSHGDWEKVKKRDGSSIEPSTFYHMKLFWYFRLGCDGKKDFIVARKVLSDISDLAPKYPDKISSDLQSTIRHCIPEIWSRYGVGGAASEREAEKYSRRFTMEAWFVNGDDSPKAREEMAKQYPKAAAINFKCPFDTLGPQLRIDPRDPWKDLW